MPRIRFDNFLTRHPLLVTFLFITICLLPAMALRDFTPDNELRYLRIADEALENGNVFAFTLDGEAYADKPPLYLWIIMLCKALLGKHSMLLLSLFSLVPAFVTVAVMDRWAGLEKVSDRIAVAFMMMTCALFLGVAVFVRMDMLMTMFIVLALRSFWLMYEGSGDRRKQEILFPVWIFLALFTKGPVGLLMPPLSVICFLAAKGKWKDIGKYLGWKTWGILAGLCAIWFTGVYIDGGKEYLENLLVHQTVGRAVNSFHHKEPFWYYLVVIWPILAPYMFLLIGALVASLRDSFSLRRSASCHPERSEGSLRSEGSRDQELFFSLTVLSTFIMLSLSSGKLAIYLVPIMPFMVLLLVETLKRSGWTRWMTWSLAVPFAIIALAALGAAFVLIFDSSVPSLSSLTAPYPFLNTFAVKLAVSLLLCGAILSLAYLLKNRPSLSVMLFGAGLLLSVYSASAVLPRANDWIGYGNLCETIPEDASVATLYLRRPGPMRVYTGKEIIDYQRDFAAFEEAEVTGREPSDSPLVLVTQTKRLDSDKALGDFVRERNHWFVGPYCLTKVSAANE